jgi:hypothetical protein
VGHGHRDMARSIRLATSLTGCSVPAAAFIAASCVGCWASAHSWAMVASMRSPHTRSAFVETGRPSRSRASPPYGSRLSTWRPVTP